MSPPQETYKVSREVRDAVEFFAVVAVALVVIIAAMSQLPPRTNGVVALALMLGLSAIFLGPLVLLNGHHRNRRARRMEAELSRAGFTFYDQPSDTQRLTAFHQIANYALLKDLPPGIDWLARKTSPDHTDALVLRHVYTTGSGKSTQHHVHTVVALSLEGPPRPGVWLTRVGYFQRRADHHTGVQDIQIDHPPLDDALRIQCHDPALPPKQ